MTDSKKQRMARLHELLADLELGQLDAAEQYELDQLLAEVEQGDPSFDADAELETVAEGLALTHAALTGSEREPMPAHVHERVLAQAGRHFGWSESGAATLRPLPRTGGAAAEGGTDRHPLLASLGWVVAVAAALALVVVLGRGQDGPESMNEFIARVSDEVVVPWAPNEEPLGLGQGVTGQVAWSDAEQAGVMRFEGLEPNDPSQAQYQLWIIDASRPGEDPVDGGVFDCTDEGVVEIPIDAKLAVGDPAAFAITLEKPGGVVVSEQEHLFLLAAVGS